MLYLVHFSGFGSAKFIEIG